MKCGVLKGFKEPSHELQWWHEKKDLSVQIGVLYMYDKNRGGK